MAGGDDIYAMLRPPLPTAADDLCSCPSGTPLKLMSAGGIGFNPVHCLNCNLEVDPERLGLSAEVAWDVASWLLTYRRARARIGPVRELGAATVARPLNHAAAATRRDGSVKRECPPVCVTVS